MATYDMDPNVVVHWGPNPLDVCTLSNSGSPCMITQYDTDLSQVQYVREGFCQDNKYVENNEAVAHAYQEELLRFGSMEASGVSNFESNHVQGSILVKDWISASNGNCNFSSKSWQLQFSVNIFLCDAFCKIVMIDCPQRVGNESCQNAEDETNNMNKVENYGLSERDDDMVHEIEFSGSSSTSGEIPVSSEDLWHSSEISDESALDGEAGKRLNQMVAIPHVPKTNEKIPSDDEEISDHQRLLDRLRLYDLIERKVEGDGNCQFRALSDQLYCSPEHHKFVREQIIQQLESDSELYGGYVPMAYNDYLKKMSKSGEWGDHVTLQAAADWYGVKIVVITSFKDTCYIEILPQTQKTERVIFLSFWAEVHYNPIYPGGGSLFIF